MRSHYLNTDLILVSRCDLRPLAEAVKRKTRLLHCGKHGTKWRATFEAHGSGQPGKREPSDDILRLLKVFARLKGKSAELWQSCISREMNVGWQSANMRPEGSMVFETDLLLELAIGKVALALTVYPSSENDL